MTKRLADAKIKAARSTPQESKRLHDIYLAHLEIASNKASTNALEIQLVAESKAGKAAVIIMDTSPSETCLGGECGEDKWIKQVEMTNTFQVIRVHGTVRWKDHGSGNVGAALLLKRANLKTGQKMERLDLAELARGSPPNEATTVTFDFKPDGRNPFWQRGAAGNCMAVITSEFYLTMP